MVFEKLKSFGEMLQGITQEEMKIFLADLSWLRTVESLVGKLVVQTVNECEKVTIFDLLCCPFCQSIMDEPVTMQCGCTCCISCVPDINNDLNSVKRTCANCSKACPTVSKPTEINVTVKSLLSNLFSTESDVIKRRKGGKEAYKHGEFLKALSIYDTALELYPHDHVTWRNRAEALLQLGRTEEALVSIQKSLEIKPFWEEGFLLKGKILLSNKNKFDAAVALLICVLMNNKSDAVSLLNEVMLELLMSPASLCTNDFDTDDQELDTLGRHFESSTLVQEESFVNILAAISQQCKQEADTINKSAHHLKRALTNKQLEQLKMDLECNLCSGLIYEPVTTSCGHLFCKDCLRRWLDHDHRCPFCRSSLFQFIRLWDLEITSLVEKVTKELFPEAIENMAELRSTELQQFASVATDTADAIPIFVCATSLPSRRIQLQIFEPRYRLMLRQCLESGSNQFGMCAYDGTLGFAEYGSMVEVKETYFTPDGRAFLEGCGGRRFKVLSKGMKDGYHTAKVRWIKDSEIPDDKLEMISKLNSDVYAEMKKFVFQYLLLHNQSSLSSQIQFPELGNDKLQSRDGPSWLWWLIDCFIDSPQHKFEFISSESLEERLNKVRSEMAQSS